MERPAPPHAGWIAGAVVAVAAVAVVSVVAFGSDDPSTAATATTTPSTARPGVIGDTELLPLPATTERTQIELELGPEDTTSQQWSLFDDAPAIPASDESIAQLRGALDTLMIDAPLEVTTDVEIGEGYELRVVASTENDARRVLFSLGTQQSVTAGFLIDLDGVTTVMGQSGQDETQLDNDELATRLGAADIDTLLQQLLLGPIRGDTLEFAERIATGPIVNLGDGTDDYGRQFIVEMPAGAARSWAPYRLAPGEEAPPLSDTTLIRFNVYLSEQERVVRVTADVPYGSTVQRIDHRLDWSESGDERIESWFTERSARPR